MNEFGHSTITFYVLDNVETRCIFNNNQLYCCDKFTGVWENNQRLLYLIIKDIFRDYSIYTYLIKPVLKFKKH